jgi:hypothetical protein
LRYSLSLAAGNFWDCSHLSQKGTFLIQVCRLAAFFSNAPSRKARYISYRFQLATFRSQVELADECPDKGEEMSIRYELVTIIIGVIVGLLVAILRPVLIPYILEYFNPDD